MRLSPVFNNRQFRTVLLLAGLWELLYFSVNIFRVGGDEFVFKLNSFLVSPLAILTSILAAMLWRQMKDSAQSRVLWGGLFLGWVCWAVAETIWAIYSLIGEDPYPSWADFFFLIGYLPMAVGFISRIVRLPKKPEPYQQLLIWLISLVTIAATTFLILIPILQEYAPELLLENLLGIFYPLADLFVLLLVLNLLFTYGPGDYGLAWRLILIGFVTVTVSDLLFSYADWNGLYYPDGNVNVLSTLAVDFPYSASYVLWTLGIYALRILLREHHIHRIDLQPRLVTNSHIFLFTNRSGAVMEVSRNYFRLFPLGDPIGKPLAQALGVSGEQQQIFQHKLIADKGLADFSIRIVTSSPEPLEGWLCGVPIMDSPGRLGEALAALVEVARQFTSRLTDPKTVVTEMQKIDSQFDQSVHSTVANLRAAPKGGSS